MVQGALFTQYFLEEGILGTETWRALDPAAVTAFQDGVRDLFDHFPCAGSHNETTTENELIWKVLGLLGWSHNLRQINLSVRGHEHVPDGLLFGDLAARDRAIARKEDYKRYADGLAIVESKRWQRPLDRKDGAALDDPSVPSTQMLRYLRQVEAITEARLRWGILTNGQHWRLYFQGARSVSEEFLELDLAMLAGIQGFDPGLWDGEPEHFLKIFFLLFRRESFLPEPTDAAGRTFHQIALDEGRLWERRVTDSLSEKVFQQVFPMLVQALAAHDPLTPTEPDRAGLEDVKNAALTLLYRLLFVLYAEDRNLLPRTHPAYADYSMHKKVREEVARRTDNGDIFSDRADSFYCHMTSLFRCIDAGDRSIGLPAYNGGLFDPARTPILTRARLPDAVFAPIVDILSRHEENGVRRRINYRDLSVRQLGSIYEQLLEFEVHADGGVVTVADNAAGRKHSGSFYTPDEPVKLIIDRAVGPLLAERMKAFTDKATELASSRAPKTDRLEKLAALDPATRFLEIKVCDPAMGSGHFLVSLVDYLADRVLAAMDEAENAVPWATADVRHVSPLAGIIEGIRRRILDHARAQNWMLDKSQLDDRLLVRRMVLKRVIYGVDKNPMAVELAKVSLWLHTFTVGAPLSFLEHHLRCGDSLCGEWVRPVEDELAKRGAMFLHRSISDAKAAARSMATVERLTDADMAEVHTSSSAFEEVEKATSPLARFLDLTHARRWLGGTVTLDGQVLKIDQAFHNLLDSTYGDPIRIALGTVAPKAPKAKATDAASAPVGKLRGKRPAYDDATAFKVAGRFLAEARALATREHFLHWQVAFPGVWENWESTEPTGGFDAVIGNPPYIRGEWLGAAKGLLEQDYTTFHGQADLYVYFYEQGLKLLRPGGRLSFIVTNKWLKAGYAEPLRRFFAEKGWLTAIVDFGHAKQIFKDADVFPCIVVVQRPTREESPVTTRVCVIPRDDLRLDALSHQIEEMAYDMPRESLGAEPWLLEPPEVRRLMAKIRAAGVPLTEYAGVEPLYGLKTGFNEAFLIDTATRNALVAKDPNCAPLIKPYLRGQDVDRWHADWGGLWMILLKSSGNYLWPWSNHGDDAEAIFSKSYPSLHSHLKLFEDKLRLRQDRGHNWWELRACSYYEKFESAKIMYQDITWTSKFCLDLSGSYSNNTGYFLPTSDHWLLAVLNAPVGWWFSWRAAQHGKDEALRYFTTFVENYPVPHPSESQATDASRLILRLIDLSKEAHSGRAALLDWIKTEHGVEKPSQKFQNPFILDSDAFVAEVRKLRGTKSRLSAAAIKDLRAEYTESVAPTRSRLAEAEALERKISDLVNQAYGLTPEEVALMWRTAPPRMPLAPPTLSFLGVEPES